MEREQKKWKIDGGGEGSGIPSLPYPSIAQLLIRLKGNSNINALLGLGGWGVWGEAEQRP